jgi:hypothetical protein
VLPRRPPANGRLELVWSPYSRLHAVVRYSGSLVSCMSPATLPLPDLSCHTASSHRRDMKRAMRTWPGKPKFRRILNPNRGLLCSPSYIQPDYPDSCLHKNVLLTLPGEGHKQLHFATIFYRTKDAIMPFSYYLHAREGSSGISGNWPSVAWRTEDATGNAYSSRHRYMFVMDRLSQEQAIACSFCSRLYN